MEEKPKIIWITYSPLSNVSFGVVSRILLANLDKKYDIYCLAMGYEGTYLRIGNYTVLPLANSIQLDFYMQEIKPDLAVLFYALPALAKIMEKPFNVKSIYYIPVEAPFVPKKYHNRLKYFQRLITTSKWSQESLRKSGFEADIVYHGVDTSFFVPKERNNEKFTFGYLGMNDFRKQVFVIMQAYATLKNKAELHLATPIKGYVNLDEFAKELNIVPKFQRAMARGIPVSPDKIREFYYTLDAYVGIGTEAFGLPALEAAATGIPNIALNYGSSPEILGDAAIYVDPCTTQWTSDLGFVGIVNPKDLAKKMKMLIEDKDLCGELGKKGIEQAKKFKWQDAIKKLDKIIEEELN